MRIMLGGQSGDPAIAEMLKDIDAVKFQHLGHSSMEIASENRPPNTNNQLARMEFNNGFIDATLRHRRKRSRSTSR